MPAADADLEERPTTPQPLRRLPFPPVTKAHILNCSYHSWHPRYRTITPKARPIPLSAPFTSYLRADGIVLPSEDAAAYGETDDDSGIYSASVDSDGDDDEEDPSTQWQHIHFKVQETIAELGGSVVPKLNWSAPKDATWIAATNSMECRTPNDIYLLLKSSDFVTHDLEQAFNGCSDEAPTADERTKDLETIPYHLVLRKTIPSYITSLEFRCFVRNRKLLCICQRDLNHYSFLPPMIPLLLDLIQAFFDDKLKHTFPDPNFTFDVYVPQPKEKGRVWLIDINPWAIRTDPLLFSWMEILTMPEPNVPDMKDLEDAFLRVYIENGPSPPQPNHDPSHRGMSDYSASEDEEDEDDEDDDEYSDATVEEYISFEPEFRIVQRDDPEAYNFNSPQYGAHKLPKDVVEAGDGGEGGLREFMAQWREVVREQERQDEAGDEEQA